MKLKIASIACSLLMVTACSSKQPKYQVVMDESDPAVSALNEAALRVARAAEQASLATTIDNRRQGKVTREYKIDLSKMPREMREPILLEGGFNGELEVFAKSLASTVGWKQPLILGKRPAAPLLVNLTEQRRAPAEWFADAAYQVHGAADVVVDPKIKQIVIQYK